MPHPLRVLPLNERDPRHPTAGGAEVHVAKVSRRMAPLEPLVTRLAADAVALAPLRHLVPTRLAVANEVDAFLHLTGRPAQLGFRDYRLHSGRGAGRPVRLYSVRYPG